MTGFASRIYLTGFMAAGKTTVGRLLAGHLEYAFVDLDALIEARAGRRIPAIFSTEGEAPFRRYEAESLEAVGAREKVVVSTGGGALATTQAMDRARSNGLVIFLDVQEDLLIDRILRNRRRPLIEKIRSEGPEAVADFVRDTLAKRRPAYERAHVIISTGRESPQSITDEILESLRQLSLNDRR